MITPPDNPPAFPVKATASGDYHEAMSLRDYFAAAALAGMLADSTPDADKREYIICECAYAHADAMLAHRSKEPTT